MLKLVIYPALLFLVACRQQENGSMVQDTLAFSEPVQVTISGYNGNAMEPFLSPDGSTLFFNNLNAAPENTNLHWATRINDSSFEYRGEISGANSADLDGVPSIDTAGNFYFVSTRSYSSSLSSLYRGNYAAGTASNVQLVNGISRQQPGWLIFDAAISRNGQTLYFADGRFENTGIPLEADLVMAAKTASGFQRLAGSAYLLQHINTEALEYAPAISANQLELYFTRLALPVTSQSTPQVLLATRKTVDDPFGNPVLISSINGFAEAPALTQDGRGIYFHKKLNDRFVLFMTRKL